ncbi:MAG TPA: DUF4345 family protein [Anaerolineales bacterium]|nr:DUF4345 family protein [Anaerolineales bacterium]
MSILLILKILCALATIVVGMVSLIRPTSVYAFTGLLVSGPRGITEIRAILGAMFVGLGAAPFLLQLDPVAFSAGGITYLAVGLARLGAIFIDKSATQSNWISLAFEIAFGVILVLG